MKKIMIVDDAPDLREVLRLYLVNAGYEVEEAGDGAEALEKIKYWEPDLMILDIMMPRLDGYGFIKALGEERTFPVIFLSAKTEVEDKIKGLHMGADDYIAKPFDPGEVLARVMAVLRRAAPKEEETVTLHGLTWDRENRRIYYRGEPIDLRAKEFHLLTLFMNRPGKVYTKREIYEYLWEEPYYNDDNTIMVHISNLRDKIEENPKAPKKIVTVRGIGYMMPKEGL